MATSIPFTDNYQDLSTDQGFQFRFNCERCGNGHLSSFAPNVTGLAGEALRAASGLFGGIFGRVASSSYDIQRMVGGPAHDHALRTAVAEVSPQFTQCKRCGQWVCREICWNGERNQCVVCSPKMDEEIAAIESQGTIEQLRQQAQRGAQNVRGIDLTGGATLQSAATGQQSVATKVSCPACSAPITAGAKFCGECGASTNRKRNCPQCGLEAAPNAKFCGDCGTRF